MIRVDDDLRAARLASRMLLQVHDELVFEVAAGELDALRDIVTNRMSGAAELSVPLDVQVGAGPELGFGVALSRRRSRSDGGARTLPR